MRVHRAGLISAGLVVAAQMANAMAARARDATSAEDCDTGRLTGKELNIGANPRSIEDAVKRQMEKLRGMTVQSFEEAYASDIAFGKVAMAAAEVKRARKAAKRLASR